MREVHSLKQIRRQEIERRCSTLDPPLPPTLLDYLESFRAACQIIKPLTDEDWEILKPRLISERPLAEIREREDQNAKLKQTLSLRDADVKSESLNVQDAARDRDTREARLREHEEQQKPLRKRLARYVEEFVKYHWVNGQDITKETCPDFAAQALIHVRGRFYADLQQERLDDSVSDFSPAIKSESETFHFQQLTLEHMKWVFDTKVKPFTEGFQRELFICNGCENNSKFFGFEGVIQHFAHKHTNTLSKGSIVVYWQAEWPERPPFSRFPGWARAKMLASAPPAQPYATSTSVAGQDTDRASRPAYPQTSSESYSRLTPGFKPTQAYQQPSPAEYPRPMYDFPGVPPAGPGPQFDVPGIQQHPGGYDQHPQGPMSGAWQNGSLEKREPVYSEGLYAAVSNGKPPGPSAPGYQAGSPKVPSSNAQPPYGTAQPNWPQPPQGPTPAAAPPYQISGNYTPEASDIRRDRGYYAAQPPDSSMRQSRQFERQEGPRPAMRRRSQSPFLRDDGVAARDIYRDRSPTIRPTERMAHVRYEDAYGGLHDAANAPRRVHTQYISEREYEAMESPVKYVIIEPGQHYIEPPIREIRDHSRYEIEYANQGIYDRDDTFVRVDSRVPVQDDLVETIPRPTDQRAALYARERQHMPGDPRPLNTVEEPSAGTRSTEPRYR